MSYSKEELDAEARFIASQNTSKWTSEKPTSTGWFWWRSTPKSWPTMLPVDADPSGVMRVRTSYANTRLDEMGGEWSGPLEPPP